MSGQANLQALVDQNYLLDVTETGSLRLFFQPADHFYHRNFEALAQAAEYLSQNTTLPYYRMVRTKKGGYTLDVNGTPSVLMVFPGERQITDDHLGAMLAEFHISSQGADIRNFPESPLNSRIDGLSSRMDALGAKHREILKKKEPTTFERGFLGNFLYFSGCAENAIQYLVDTSLDFPNPEPMALSHYRFSGVDSLIPENPALWVADDRSRDLAEWLRLLAWNGEAPAQNTAAEAFLDDYENRFPLSRQTAANLFGKLLFPLPYVECCERYFFSQGREDRHLLNDVMLLNEDRAERQERMLYFLSRRYSAIKVPEWLARTSA
ncbi:spore coat protein YutH [Sporolactobacillus pectinivorans]|uniref:spore coat protein YutH n=1 Tax=Sporolactobacillus pectinivorans TaxID=1591408 RepID=UPI000C2658BD|nr:spore coat protein YutH [Sporolactobacillus pectinivorans]